MYNLVSTVYTYSALLAGGSARRDLDLDVEARGVVLVVRLLRVLGILLFVSACQANNKIVKTFAWCQPSRCGVDAANS